MLVPEDQKAKAAEGRSLWIASGTEVIAVDAPETLKKPKWSVSAPGRLRVKLDGGAHRGLEVLVLDGWVEPARDPEPRVAPRLLFGLIVAAMILSILAGAISVIVEKARRRERARRLGWPTGSPTLSNRPARRFVRSPKDDAEWLGWISRRNAHTRARPRRDYIIIE